MFLLSSIYLYVYIYSDYFYLLTGVFSLFTYITVMYEYKSAFLSSHLLKFFFCHCLTAFRLFKFLLSIVTFIGLL